MASPSSDAQQERIKSRLFKEADDLRMISARIAVLPMPKQAFIDLCVPYVSFVLSVMLDKWTDEQVDNGQRWQRCPTSYSNVLSHYTLGLNDLTPKKPEAQTPRVERELFIRAKYEEKLFSGGVATPSQVSSRRSPTKSTATTQGMVEYTGVVVIDLKEAKELAGMKHQWQIRTRTSPSA
ncbi:hypothetical protein GN958_ATG23377 [Phytophthora infestans]|uniref:Uncharacterized protein n=1 Tax=Phytophthora infestans TaxID=4787 RepID=A0A8S9TKT4_PHYIN|nr:hypothetical protein GN958_ATG23377 [Phytophthora infestans]